MAMSSYVSHKFLFFWFFVTIRLSRQRAHRTQILVTVAPVEHVIANRAHVFQRSATMEATVPCRTIYIRNLPDKLNKVRVRLLLHALLSTYGHVIGIIAEKTIKLRGQAFVTFEHQSSATIAVRKLHATTFMGRQISVTYAKAVTDRHNSSKQIGSDQPRAEQASKKRAREPQTGRTGVPGASEPSPQLSAPTSPNCVLFVENLPNKVDEVEGGRPITVAIALTDLFARFAGFMEVRAVPGKEGIAFVEFDSEQNSAVAMTGLQGYPLGTPQQRLQVSFAKK